MHLASLFIPPLLDRPEGGTLITSSSVLGSLGASHLTAYTATKAALSAFHASLSAEIQSSAYPPNSIKTILVAPGQLDTPLFAAVNQNTVQNFFGPKVEVKELAMKIVSMIDRGEGGEVRLPAYASMIAWMFVLPVGLQSLLRAASGLDEAMRAAVKSRRVSAGNGHMGKR